MLKMRYDQRMILLDLAAGKTTKEICGETGREISSVNRTVSFVRQNNGLRTREQLMAQFGRECANV